MTSASTNTNYDYKFTPVASPGPGNIFQRGLLKFETNPNLLLNKGDQIYLRKCPDDGDPVVTAAIENNNNLCDDINEIVSNRLTFEMATFPHVFSSPD